MGRRDHFLKKFNLSSGNIKKTWELINELRGKSKSKLKASFIVDGNLVTDRRKIADGFNSSTPSSHQLLGI